jgi:hypothetical protein
VGFYGVDCAVAPSSPSMRRNMATLHARMAGRPFANACARRAKRWKLEFFPLSVTSSFPLKPSYGCKNASGVWYRNGRRTKLTARPIVQDLLGEIRLQPAGDEIYAEFETRPEQIFSVGTGYF